MSWLDWLLRKRPYPTEPLNWGLAEFSDIDLEGMPPTDHPNYGNDTSFMGIGTGSLLLLPVCEAITLQELETTGDNQIRVGSSSLEDLTDFKRVERERDEWIRSSEGHKPRKSWFHPNSPLIGAYHLGRGSVNGLGSDPMWAIKLLQENNLVRKDLRKMADDIISGYHAHRLTGGKTVLVSGIGGGNEPWGRYLIDEVSHGIVENVRINTRIYPSRDEHLAVANALAETYRLIQNGTPDNHLNIVTRNQQRGAQANDDCLAHGLITLMGTAKRGREIDGKSLTRTLQVFSCGWVEARTAAVHVPLAPASEKWPKERERPFLVLLPEERGGRTVEILLSAAKRLMGSEDDALHLLVVTGHFLNNQEMEDLKGMLMDLAPGRIIPVINHLRRPKKSGALLRFTMCNFMAADHLPPLLVDMYREGVRRFSRKDGLTLGEFLDQIPPPEGLDKAEAVEAALGELRN